ncbi:MAG: hypothetical protein ACOYJO_00565 [Eubacterium sp.]
MSISDIEKKNAVKFALLSAFCLVFALIYEHFSHQVYSAFMIFAFAIPLLGGALPHYLIFRSREAEFDETEFDKMGLGDSGERKQRAERLGLDIYNYGIETLTVGSIFKGVLDIYGTTSNLTPIYLIAGVGLAIVGVLIYLYARNMIKYKSGKLPINNREERYYSQGE